MSSDIILALITGGTGILGAFVGYRASIKGAKLQIEHERGKLNDAINQQHVYAHSVIESLLKEELINNFNTMFHKELRIILEESDKPTPLVLNINLTTSEYDVVKYELIKNESPLVQQIIDIYNVFFLIKRKVYLEKFTPEEYNELKRIYNILLDKFSD